MGRSPAVSTRISQAQQQPHNGQFDLAALRHLLLIRDGKLLQTLMLVGLGEPQLPAFLLLPSVFWEGGMPGQTFWPSHWEHKWQEQPVLSTL